MTNAKPCILIVVIALVASAIYFINSNSVKKGGSSEPVAIIPRAPSESNGATSSQTISSMDVKKETMPSKYPSAQEKSKRYELAKEITTPDGFVNTDGKPITINGLIGKKVILVDFWTYSCINCQRTTPYLNAWYEKYKDKGFVIVGVHTPEFEFEKDYNNVKTAVEKFGIKFPVVLDNDYSTWTAYKNRYWPRKYLVDIDGYIVYDHIGEGGYEETEQKIQEALAERMSVLGEAGTINQSITKEVPTTGGPRSPETYFGALRNQLFGNGAAGVSGDQKGLTIPTKINSNILYLSSDWNIADEFAENKSSEAKIIFRYQAKDVYFVAGSESDIKIKIIKDGKLMDEQTVNQHKLYHLIQDSEPGEHTLEIIIESPGLRAYTFTFG